jgi:glycosyltransferase involved in cell wall biosynthesis
MTQNPSQDIALSVVVPCFNASATIGRQLNALAEQQWSQAWEVIVSDNGSTDGSLAIAEKYKDRLHLRIVDASQRRGASHARNKGAAAARGISLAFCDADDEVAPGWVAAMSDALSKHEFVACRVDFTKLNDSRARIIFQDHGQHSGLCKAWFPPYLWHAGAGTLGVRKALHDAVGGFDESVLAQEDTDYCFRIQQRGVELKFVPGALLHICCRDSAPKLARQAFIWSEYTVFLYKRYRRADPPDTGRWRTFIRQCKNLLLSLPQVHSPEGRALWMWKFGWQLGRLSGSIKYRVPPV